MLPPYPKELILAVGTEFSFLVVGKGRKVRAISIVRSAHGILPVNSPTPTVGGMAKFSNARVVLMMLVMPLAASLWPKLDLTEAIITGSLFAKRPDSVRKTWESAFTSIRSPTGVPVPWHSA